MKNTMANIMTREEEDEGENEKKLHSLTLGDSI